jgi:hypothetical protein
VPDTQAALDQIERANKNDLALLRESTVPAVAAALLQLRRDLLAVARKPRDPRFSPQGVGQEIAQETAAARQKCQAALDSADAGAKQAISNIRDDLSSRTHPKRDAQEQLVDELQRAQAARRLDILSASGVEAGEKIMRAAAAGDRVMLAVLREDLPLMADRNDRQDQNQLENLLQLLDRVEAPLLSANQAAARKVQAELATGQAALTTSFSLARGEARGGSQSFGANVMGPVSTIADWPGGGYRVEFKTPDGGLSTPDTAIQNSTAPFLQGGGVVPPGLTAQSNTPAREAK